MHRLISKFAALAIIVAAFAVPLVASAQGIGPNPVFKAVEENNLTELRRQLLNGTSPNVRDQDGNPLIVLAAAKNRAYLISVLLEFGANVNQTNEEKRETATIVAADRGAHDTLELLIEGEADLDAEDNQGETALIKAVLKGHIRSVRALLDGGADMNHTDYTGRTALAHAEESRHRGIANLLSARGATY
ncbi:MAG: ankyrin repeat domain-containing protein [Alphaproteobacteria bacterium]